MLCQTTLEIGKNYIGSASPTDYQVCYGIAKKGKKAGFSCIKCLSSMTRLILKIGPKRIKVAYDAAMKLDLNREQEQVVHEALQTGRFHDVAEFLDEALLSGKRDNVAMR